MLCPGVSFHEDDTVYRTLSLFFDDAAFVDTPLVHRDLSRRIALQPDIIASVEFVAFVTLNEQRAFD